MSRRSPLRPFPRSAAAAALAALLTAVAACSDDDPTGTEASIVGTWQAASFEALGTDFVAAGMELELTLTDAGTYMIDVTNDLIGVCPDEEPDCVQQGAYTSTDTQVTIDPGLEDEVTFTYTVTGTTLTLNGAINETPVTATFMRE